MCLTSLQKYGRRKNQQENVLQLTLLDPVPHLAIIIYICGNLSHCGQKGKELACFYLEGSYVEGVKYTNDMLCFEGEIFLFQGFSKVGLINLKMCVCVCACVS